MGLSAHPSINKGCDYFGVKLIIVPLDPVTLQTDLKAMERAITSNTIAIIGSAPGWPHGVVDDIEAMSDIAIRYGIGLHVDSCLGGFIIAFHENVKREAKGKTNVFKVDYRVPGVTSLSCDNHKYGIAPKGISTLTFRNKDVRKHAYYAISNWPGGLYATA